ncbi:preprotein translocase subunit SecG [Candidatus Sororendozoicomonas aggregata]|uniref:preprotein translocase subunit SecG n=1 Tax=Candidatus Sororendozoicomonas aggregata TaxID=3073239 RepID=UPI002ED6AD6D
METIVLIIHVLVAAAVIGLILIQQGKGAEAGASFGAGASQTVFGSQGSASFLSRTTAALATLFFLTSFGLAMMARDKVDVVRNAGVPVEVEQPVPSGDAPISSEKNAVDIDAPVIKSTPVESKQAGEKPAENQ